MQCGAKSKRTGEPCRQSAMRNGRCRLHGGKTPRGTASPHFKHGRFSSALSGGLLERYEKFLAGNIQASDMREIVAGLAILACDDLKKLNANAGSDEVRERLRRTLDSWRKLIEGYHRVLVATKQMVALEEMLVLAAQTKGIIQRFVSPDRLAEFEQEFEQVFNRKDYVN